MAVYDDILLKNPFEFQLHTVVVNDSVKRDAITRKQEREFLEIIENERIIVNHQLQRTPQMKYIIVEPKTGC